MGKLRLILVLGSLWLTASTIQSVSAQVPVSVNFELTAPSLAPSTPVYLTGSVPALGNWKTDAITMEYVGNQRWRALVIFERAMPVRYRYTLGTKEQVGADERGQPLASFRVQTERRLTVRDTINRWTDENTVVEAAGRVTGDVRYHRYVKGDNGLSRDLVVWLPRFYDQRPQLNYPVLYLNDGQDLFDPATAAGGRDLGIDEAMDKLIREQTVEPVIVVGIYHGDEHRLEEFTPESARGQAYMNFVVHTVKPLIESRYRVRAGREHTVLGGAAMGGLMALATAWEHADQFGAVMAFSPAFSIAGGVGDFAGFDAIPWFVARHGTQRRPVFFYLDNGAQGVEAQAIQPGIDEMVALLEQWGYRWERDFVFIQDLDATHGFDAWRERFPNAFTKALRGARRLHDAAITEASDASLATLKPPAPATASAGR